MTATIVFFDGVHKGHRFLIEQLLEDSPSMIVTFRNHPLSVLQPEKPIRLLTTFEEKMELLNQTGVTNIVALEFNRSIASMTEEEFATKLNEKYDVDKILKGFDNNIGNLDDTSAVSSLPVIRARQLEGISSSLIRQALEEGRIEDANEALGYNYFIQGKVVPGKQLGRTIGFPTANIEVPEEKLLPLKGAYVVKVEEQDMEEDKTSLMGMANIGDTVEIHIFNFDGDIYNKTIKVEFIQRLRDEMSFHSLDELKHQLETDKDTVFKILNKK